MTVLKSPVQETHLNTETLTESVRDKEIKDIIDIYSKQQGENRK